MEKPALDLGERPGFTAFMRLVDPRYPQINGISVTRSMEEQTDEVVKSIRYTVSQTYTEIDVSLTCNM